MKLHDIFDKADIKYPNHLKDVEVQGITSRSSEVKENYIFVCLKGTKNDGHDYIAEAFSKGAVACVIENPKYECDRTVTVDCTRSALANLLNVFNGEPTKKLKFIGVTGTNGKTSVTVMIKNILDECHLSCELIGTLNCSSFSENSKCSHIHFTTPDPEELYPMLRRMSDAGVELVVMEASSHALKLKKLDPIKFDVGIFTNLTEDHLDFHLTMEDYFKSKLELFEKCVLGIINIDDEFGKRIAEIAPCKIKTCSTIKNADYFAKDVLKLENGTKYVIANDGTELEIYLKILGSYSIMNSMQACACARELNIDDETIKKSFDGFSGVKGRLEKTELFEGRNFSVFIDYAHTPDALLKALDTLKSIKNEKGRLVLLFGCGGDREKQKRRIMGEIAVNNADFVIITSDNPRSESPMQIINDILVGVGDKKNFTVIPDRRKAIEYAIANAMANDIILLAGKGHENYEINAHGIFHFDEREVLSDVIKLQGGMNYED